MSWLELLRRYFPDLLPILASRQYDTGEPVETEGGRGEAGGKGTSESGPLSADERSTIGAIGGLSSVASSVLGGAMPSPGKLGGAAVGVLGGALPGLNNFTTATTLGILGISSLADMLGAKREMDPWGGLETNLQGVMDTEGAFAAASKAADLDAAISAYNDLVAADLTGLADYDARTAAKDAGWGPGGWEGTPAGLGSTSLGGAQGKMGGRSSVGAPSVGNPDSPFSAGGGPDPGNSDTAGTADSTGGSRGGEGTDRARGGVDVIRKPMRLRFGERPAARPETVISVPRSMLRPGRQPREQAVINMMRRMMDLLEPRRAA
jgi:hypothetical protein